MHNARGYECLCLLSSSRPRRCIHTHKHLNEHMYINILLSWDFFVVSYTFEKYCSPRQSCPRVLSPFFCDLNFLFLICGPCSLYSFSSTDLSFVPTFISSCWDCGSVCVQDVDCTPDEKCVSSASCFMDEIPMRSVFVHGLMAGWLVLCQGSSYNYLACVEDLWWLFLWDPKLQPQSWIHSTLDPRSRLVANISIRHLLC